MQLCAWRQTKRQERGRTMKKLKGSLSLYVSESEDRQRYVLGVMQSVKTLNTTMQHISKCAGSCANQGASQLISILILVTMNSMTSLAAHDTKEDQLPGNHSEF